MLTLTAAPATGAAAAPPPLRITAEQFARNAEAGVYPPDRRIELLDGIVVLRDARDASASGEVTLMGLEHIDLVERATEILRPLATAGGGWYRDQKAVHLPPWDHPEPDGADVRGERTDYSGRYPEADDILVLLEVAYSSLHTDRTTKSRIYAGSGVPVYWILDVAARTLEVRTDPDPAVGAFRSTVTLTAADTVAVPLPGGAVDLALADLLG